PLGTVAHGCELREDRVPPAGVGGDKEPHVHRQDVVGRVGEPLDDLADLLEDLRAIVSPNLSLAGAEHCDLLAMPVGRSGSAEDPLDDCLLRVLLALGDLGVTCDVISAHLKSGLMEQPGRRIVRAGTGLVAIIRGVAPRVLLADGPEGLALARLGARGPATPGVLCPESSREEN